MQKSSPTVNHHQNPRAMTEDQRLHQLRAIATLLDSQFKGPGGFRFGIDAIIGMIPVVGDVTTTLFSLYILTQSASLGCSTATILRMGLNIAIDNLISAIPVLGNLFDFVWKSNNKNIVLLEAHLQSPRRVTLKSRFVIAGVSLALLALLIITGLTTFYLLRAGLEWLQVFAANAMITFT